MKTILAILALVLLSAANTSCSARAEEEQTPPPTPQADIVPEAIKILEDQVAFERERRLAAEDLAAAEAQRSRNRELAAVGLGLLAVISFFAGTTIGSLARRHALVPA